MFSRPMKQVGLLPQPGGARLLTSRRRDEGRERSATVQAGLSRATASIFSRRS